MVLRAGGQVRALSRNSALGPGGRAGAGPYVTGHGSGVPAAVASQN